MSTKTRDELIRLFKTESFYGVLGVPNTATVLEIKKAYLNIARAVHPDRNPEDPDAKEKFQLLTKVHETLSDPERRAVYDETGSVDDEDFAGLEQDRNWDEYWRLLYRKISLEDIEAFARKYKGSDEEAADVCAAYVACAGDMDGILERVMLAAPEDVPRFELLLRSAVDDGRIQRIPGTLQAESERKRAARTKRYAVEAKEAEAAARAMQVQSEQDVCALILQRQQGRAQALSATIASLEGKYTTKKAKARKQTEPTEAEFEAAQKRVSDRSQQKRGSR